MTNRIELHFADGTLERHDEPRGGPHFMIAARHGKAGPSTVFVFERRVQPALPIDPVTVIYREVAVQEGTT